MARLLPFARRDVRAVLGRAVRLRCPRCGEGRLWAGWWRMAARCAACDLRYELERGFFVGAVAIDWLVMGALAMVPVVLLDPWFGLSLAAQLQLGLCLALLVPLLLFRYSRSLWLALVYLATSHDARQARARSRPSPRPRSR